VAFLAGVAFAKMLLFLFTFYSFTHKYSLHLYRKKVKYSIKPSNGTGEKTSRTAKSRKVFLMLGGQIDPSISW